MAHIAFSMMTDEQGHIHCSLTLARALRAAGHVVSYVGLEDDEAFITERGFPYVTIEYPNRKRARDVKAEAAARSGARRLLWSITEPASQARAHGDFIVSLARESATFGRYGWDLLVCDDLNPLGSLVAHRAGIKCVLLQTTLPRTRRLPPWTSSLVPEHTILAQVRSSLAWQRHDLAERLDVWQLVSSVLGRVYHLDSKSLLERFEVPEKRVRTMDPLELNLPKLIACPAAFDFEDAASGNEYYVEPLVDLEREEPAFDFSRVDPEKKVVYVSMGTQSWLMKNAPDFYRRVLAAAAARPRWQFIVNVAATVREQLGDVPANALLVEGVPQLRLLSRAAVMMMHGGLNSTKECILTGVPMVVFPIDRDQPSVGARVAHHGLGLLGDYRHTSAPEMVALLDEVLTNPSFALSMSTMRERFLEAQRARPALTIIDRVLRN